MKVGKKKWCLLLTAFLLMGLTTGLGVAAPPSMRPPRVSTTHDPITIDGDPSDWFGTAGPANTYYIDTGEGIWRDAAFDDTGNGSYIYPNCTHTSPAIPDSKGWEGYAYAYTGYPHGGMVDLMEFRVTGNDTTLFLMFRFENMCNQAVAVEWNKDAHTSGSAANATGFGKILIQVYIDQDGISGSGRTNSTMWGNFLFPSEAAWDAVIDIAGDPCAHTYAGGYGFPRVEFADGTIHVLNDTVASANPLQPRKAVYIQADCDIYPSCIELQVPYSVIGDPRGKGWKFFMLAGGYDEGRWRQVWATEDIGFMALFRFHGGEGSDPPDMGLDPNIVDMAFTNKSAYASQEALLNSFSTTGQLVVVDSYLNIYFDENGDVIVPWIPIYSLLVLLPILLMAILYARKKKLGQFVEHQ